MKKVLLLVLAMLTIGSASAQSYRIEGLHVQIEKIFEDTGLSAEQCSDRMFKFYKIYYKDDLNRILREYSTSLLVWESEFEHVALANMGAWEYDVEYEVRIYFKDNRMRCIISTDKVEGRSSVMSTSYYLPEAAPIAEKHPVGKTQTTRKVAEQIFETTLKRMHSLMGSIETIVYAKPKADNW